MKLSIYSIYDSVAEVFNKPFTSINNATAEREFVQSVKEQPHKNDYILYYLGDFNDANGQIVQKDPVRLLGGIDIKMEAETVPEGLKVQAV